MEPSKNNLNDVNSDILCLSTSPVKSVSSSSRSMSVSASVALHDPTQTFRSIPLSYVASPPAQTSIYTWPPLATTQTTMAYQGVIASCHHIPSQTVHIHDYMIWSMINVFIGCILLGVVAVSLSWQTKNRKREGNIEASQRISKITLICNILITGIFFLAIAVTIVYFTHCFASDPNRLAGNGHS